MRDASQSEQTLTVVGIDEAGYGPRLGPLVVSAVAFDVPVSLLKRSKNPADGPDLWSILRRSVMNAADRKDPRLAVADSKVLYGRATADEGLGLLERAALTFLAQRGDTPSTLRQLLAGVCPDVCGDMDLYPWYAGSDADLPARCSPADLATQANALRGDLTETGVRFLGAWVEALPEGHYNRLVTRTRNKSVVLFGQTVRLVQRVSDALGRRPMRVWIDRQGGRIGYHRPLMTAFEDVRLDILEESPQRSSYRLSRQPAPWIIAFCTKGEKHHLPIALASVYSKYVRELFMMCFNRYWSAYVANLRPTAGYAVDGDRFLADIEPVIRRERIDRAMLVRIL